MNYVEPILYVSGDDEIFILNHSKEKIKKDFDIMIPYEYQRIHFNLILNYIAPDYYKMCPTKFVFEDTLSEIKKSPYADYFLFFIIKFLTDNEKYMVEKWVEWLNTPKPLYIRERNIEILRYFQLKRYYNTIIVDAKMGDGNRWNRLWGIPPNVYNKKIMFKVLDHLTEGGKLIFLHPKSNFDLIFDCTREGFKEIESNYFIKEETPKNEFELPRKWL